MKNFHQIYSQGLVSSYLVLLLRSSTCSFFIVILWIQNYLFQTTILDWLYFMRLQWLDLYCCCLDSLWDWCGVMIDDWSYFDFFDLRWSVLLLICDEAGEVFSLVSCVNILELAMYFFWTYLQQWLDLVEVNFH